MSFLERRDVSAGLRVPGATPYEVMAWQYVAAIPLLYLLGLYVRLKKLLCSLLGLHIETNSALVDGISINSRRMKEGAARWPALNTCYNFVAGEGASSLERTVDAWWMNIRNAQAVRNRLKIAKRELRAAIRAHAAPGRAVKVLSLAAGTAQGVIEVAAELKRFGIDVDILLIDTDESALRYAERLAREHGVAIRALPGNVLFFTRFIGEFKADIVEMMGLIDYLKNGLAVQLIRKIRLYLPVNGHFFTCHIHPNHERYFLKHVVDWDMLYRSRDELEDLLVDAGFLQPELHTEPHGIHSVAVARRL